MTPKALFLALAAALAALAEQLDTETPNTPEGAAAGEAPKPRGRPRKEAADETEAPKGKTYEELQKVLQPLIQAKRVDEVKPIIAKYAIDLKTLATKPEHHAAFLKDIGALTAGDPMDSL